MKLQIIGCYVRGPKTSIKDQYITHMVIDSKDYIDGFVQFCGNSSAIITELPQYSTNHNSLELWYLDKRQLKVPRGMSASVLHTLTSQQWWDVNRLMITSYTASIFVVLNSFRKPEIIFVSSVISQQSNGSANWNHSPWKTMTHLSWVPSCL